ncbi:DUF1883 domain-containing protein [Thiorhodococcus mannitoliphagus]|uniref:DUF1883 domain-containing protein n=1 Tax=Thiorhodococcus mannitoliphagus TaxID=329406 RepID=A0A6P1DNS7_9GAMM|nr:DUF1883 domain-containing protein [Thiorhodococcus mannitoliphagus]NEX19897.1 DUF1883 domain-containing protein [Thiorhodococcus mannitoliphagus]
MKFIHTDLGNRKGGEIVQVTLSGNSANVRLMDSSNFQSYKSGRKHTYYGGHATKSPVRLKIPRAGHWHVAVDTGGYPGQVSASVNVLPGPLPAFTEAPLSSIPSLYQDHHSPNIPIADDIDKEFDVFISHASEDKDEVVRPLATALKEKGLSVWYDEFELRIGDSLRRKIDRGVATSKFGVIVLSEMFLRKGWTNYELDGLVTRQNTGEQILLPIWHNITKKQVIEYSPSLADKLARSTATHTVEEIAAEIAELIHSKE